MNAIKRASQSPELSCTGAEHAMWRQTTSRSMP